MNFCLLLDLDLKSTKFTTNQVAFSGRKMLLSKLWIQHSLNVYTDSIYKHINHIDFQTHILNYQVCKKIIHSLWQNHSCHLLWKHLFQLTYIYSCSCWSTDNSIFFFFFAKLNIFLENQNGQNINTSTRFCKQKLRDNYVWKKPTNLVSNSKYFMFVPK